MATLVRSSNKPQRQPNDETERQSQNEGELMAGAGVNARCDGVVIACSCSAFSSV